jgi:hypothetical protein
LGLLHQGQQERGLLRVVERGGAGYGSPAPEWSALEKA